MAEVTNLNQTLLEPPPINLFLRHRWHHWIFLYPRLRIYIRHRWSNYHHQSPRIRNLIVVITTVHLFTAVTTGSLPWPSSQLSQLSFRDLFHILIFWFERIQFDVLIFASNMVPLLTFMVTLAQYIWLILSNLISMHVPWVMLLLTFIYWMGIFANMMLVIG